jgi:hypothetical protein
VTTLDLPRTDSAALGLSQARVFNSEWIKLRSLRSTWFSIAAALVATVGLGILFSKLRGDDIARNAGDGGYFQTDVTALSLRGFYLAQLAVGVLGVLFVTGEYATGMIRATLSAVPKRLPVWLAKSVVFAAFVFVISLSAAFIAFLGGQAVLSGHHVAGFVPVTGQLPNGANVTTTAAHTLGVSLGSPGALRAVFCAALYLVGVGLIGVGLGFAIRNTGGAIAALFGLLLVLPLLAQALPSSISDHVIKFLPLMAGTQSMTTLNDPTSLSPWDGIGVFYLYVIAALAIGAVVLRRRDA